MESYFSHIVSRGRCAVSPIMLLRFAKMRWRRWLFSRSAPSTLSVEVPYLANAVVSTRKRRNPQHLAWIDLAGIGQ
jgi:hypothetical protein